MQGFAFDTSTVIDICRNNAVTAVGVFGSMARGEATADSDLDLLVNFGERKSLLDLAKLQRDLSTAIGRNVDLLTKDAISPYLRDRILSEVRMIYDTPYSPKAHDI